MINTEIKDEIINLKLDGDYMTVITEIVIVIARISYDQPETINYIVEFLKNGLEQDIKKGLDLDTILNKLMSAYFEYRKKGGKNNG